MRLSRSGEGDGVQLRRPTMDGGANKVSLIEAQRKYQDFGACDRHGRQHVRQPDKDEPLIQVFEEVADPAAVPP
ncbi:CPCC family cysteine-rich protein [Streptomyces goshikiensis]|uniref:CPCC family cysteine-rich protein n=1 Tax=Streptomyces TaxID=1883 RepID=UPI0022789E94|nr:CPCC family cysteine-rich protein [Streptomyces sp. CB02120-2]